MLNSTWSFFLNLFMPIIVYFLALVSCIIAIKSIKKKRNEKDEKNGNKYNKFVAIATLCGFIIPFYTAFRVEIPEPEIYIVNHNTQNYNEEYEMEIKNIEVFENYYTTNGTDPEYGVKYTDSFKVHNPTSVFAKSKFLWWWSSKALFVYPIENFDNNMTQKDNKSIIPTKISNETEIQITDEKQTETKSQPKETEQQDIQPDNSETEIPSPNISNDDNSSPVPQTSEPQTPNEGINASEGSALMTYINQYRTQSGINELTWDSGLEQVAQNVATSFATGGQPDGDFSYLLIGRQCNGAQNAQRAVSDWMTGNDYIPSESDSLLNSGYTQIGGALYYLPNGNEYGYHYFWVVCLR